MKKLVSVLSSILILLSVTACSDLNGSGNSKDEAEGISLTTGFSARSIGLPYEISSDADYAATISYEKGDETEYFGAKSASSSGNVSTTPVFIPDTPISGETAHRFIYDYKCITDAIRSYTITVYAFSPETDAANYSVSSSIAYGTASVDLEKGQRSADLGSVIIYPHSEYTGKGSVELKLTWDSGDKLGTMLASAASPLNNISFYKVTYTNSNDTTVKNRTLLSNEEYNFTAAFDNTTSCIIISDQNGVPAGIYEAELNFGNTSDGIPITVLSSQKTLTFNVFQGLKTDCWYDDSGTALKNDDGEPKALKIQYAAQKYFYVRGASFADGAVTDDTWFSDKNSASGNDTSGDGTIAKPFATIQKAVDLCNSMSNEDSTLEFTIYMDGITKEGSKIEISSPVNIKGLNSEKKAVIQRNDTTTSMLSVANGTTATIENVVIDGNSSSVSVSDSGAGINNAGTLTLKDSTVTNCKTQMNGGGIFNSGKLTLTDSTVTDCSATAEGSGIYQNGTLIIRGNSSLDSSNDIYLVSEKLITVVDSTDFTGSASVTLESPSVDSGSETQVLTSESALSWAACNKFNIKNDSGKYCVKPDSSDSKKGVLALKGAQSIVSFSTDTYTLSISTSNSTFGTETEVTLSITYSAGNSVTTASYSLALKQNGDTVISSTGEKLTVPAWVPAGSYTIHAEAVINNMTFDKDFSFEIEVQ